MYMNNLGEPGGIFINQETKMFFSIKYQNKLMLPFYPKVALLNFLS